MNMVHFRWFHLEWTWSQDRCLSIGLVAIATRNPILDHSQSGILDQVRMALENLYPFHIIVWQRYWPDVRIEHCHSMCILWDISFVQECKYWAVQLYMVWNYALVVPTGIFFPWHAPLTFWGGVHKSIIMSIETDGVAAANSHVKTHSMMTRNVEEDDLLLSFIVNWYWLLIHPFARQAVRWGPFIYVRLTMLPAWHSVMVIT